MEGLGAGFDSVRNAAARLIDSQSSTLEMSYGCMLMPLF